MTTTPPRFYWIAENDGKTFIVAKPNPPKVCRIYSSIVGGVIDDMMSYTLDEDERYEAHERYMAQYERDLEKRREQAYWDTRPIT